MPELTKLREEIAEFTTVKESVKATFTALAARIRALAQSATDLAALKAAVLAEANTLDAGNADLTAAVVENTPAEDEPPAP